MTLAAGKAVRTARLSDAPLPPVDRSIPPWPGGVVRIDGCDLFVRRTPGPPGAEPAVYVHGLGGASTDWTDLAAVLSGRLSGEAPDLPGFGRSGPAPRGDYSVAGHARTVIAYLEQRGGQPVHLFGNSLGGAVTVVVAARRPDLVRTLTLVSPAMPYLRPRPGTNFTLLLLVVPGLGGWVLRRLDRRPAEQQARAVIDLVLGDPSTVPPNRFAEAVEEELRRRDVPWAAGAFADTFRGIVRSYLLPGRQSLWRSAARVQAPTLLVWGGRDKVVPIAVAPRTAATIPDARLLVLPTAGHVSQLEAPDVVARAVLALLDDAAGR